MADLDRRRFATGIASFIAAAATTFRGQSAQAQDVASQADARLCKQRGGRVESRNSEAGKKNGRFCVHDVKDPACIEASKDKDELWTWNYKTDKCEESGCFLTTACCEELGLGDNCFELRTLRHFRDSYLMHAPQGSDHVAAYYQLAPKILAAVPSNRRRPELLTVYAYFILPSVLCTKLGLYRTARRIYTALMNRMIRKHLASDHPLLTL
ncbi:MAG: CFI-box-CTERM domain-containing protein [Pseudomonadota bacterium]